MTWIQLHPLLSVVIAFVLGQFSMLALLGLGRAAAVGDELVAAESARPMPVPRTQVGWSA